METSLSRLSFSELSANVEALPYHELVELMGVIVNRLRKHEETDKSKDEAYWKQLVENYRGCMKGTWDGVDAVEYQRSLREDRDIG